jgi:hypothetical protein
MVSCVSFDALNQCCIHRDQQKNNFLNNTYDSCAKQQKLFFFKNNGIDGTYSIVNPSKKVLIPLFEKKRIVNKEEFFFFLKQVFLSQGTTLCLQHLF